jgi:dihydrofolate reductase
MRNLVVFNHISLDGYIADEHGDMSWAHPRSEDAEWNAFVAANAGQGGGLVFGRRTYEMMADYWPTPAAHASFPQIAERMNALPKVVFSRILARVSWNHTTLLKDDLAAEIQKLKAASGQGLTILGSGSIVSQAARAGLVDEFQCVVHPVVLGTGKTMFESLGGTLRLRLATTRVFANGNVLLCYRPEVETGAAAPGA